MEALAELGGRSPIVPICRWVWEHKHEELQRSGDLFFTWQYDIRWAGTQLRALGKLRPAEVSPSGVWERATKATQPAKP